MPTPASSHPQIARWLAHVRALAEEIGPRGPTTPGERRGAEYARSQFERMGLHPHWETFSSARSIFLPHVIGSLFMLLAFAIYPLGGKVSILLAALLSALVIISELQELSFRNNLIRWMMPKGKSQNVYAVIEPRAEHQQDILLVGHLDSQRTPLFFRSRQTVKIYDRFTTLIFAAYLAQTVLFTLSIFFEWRWVWYGAIPAAICALIMIVFFVEADLSPFTAGANDNASAAGMVLTLAEEFAQQPLQHTRIFAICTGCEETQHYGMLDWYKRHLPALKNPQALVFEMLGVAGPAYLLKEGIIVPFKADPGLVSKVEALSQAHPEWEAYPVNISGGNTEMADALRNGVPAICLFGMSRDGEAPYWHQRQDTFDKMNPAVMEKFWGLTRALIETLDGSNSPG